MTLTEGSAMRIALTTPAGNVGHHLVRLLVDAGIAPRLLTRHPQKLPEDLAQHVEPARADSREPDQVVAATRGIDTLYWVDPPAASPDPLEDYARATEALTTAVLENGIRRVVFQSSVGAEKRHGAGEIDGLAATEVALDELDMDVTHLRCGYFFTNLLLDIESLRAGTLRTVHPLEARMSWVAPRDIAGVAAVLLRDPDWSGRQVRAVHGPEDLSWSEVAEILTAELGHPVHVDRISDREMRAMYLEVGMPPATADAVLEMSTGLREDFVPEQARSAESTTPTTLRTWVREELLPML